MTRRAISALCIVSLLFGCSTRGWGWYLGPPTVAEVTVSRAVDARDRLEWRVRFANGHVDEGQLPLREIFPPDCPEPDLQARTIHGPDPLRPGESAQLTIASLERRGAKAPAGAGAAVLPLPSCNATVLALAPPDEGTVFLAFTTARDAHHADLELGMTGADFVLTVAVIPILGAYAAVGLTVGLTFFTALCVVSFGRCFQSDW